MSIRSREIALAILTVSAVLVLGGYYLNVPGLKSLARDLQTWAIVIAAFALGIGAVNLISFHSTHILRRTKRQWYLSALLLLSFVVTLITGLALTPAHPVFKWLFSYVLSPLALALYSILGFFIFSAAYRALRIKTYESSILLVCALVAIISSAPVYEAIWSGFATIGKWFNDVPGTAGARALYLGVAIGTVIFGLRTIFWYERSQLGGE